MELDWNYFRRLYEGLYDHHDDVDVRRRYLSGQQRTAADHLAELAPLRKREPIPASGYTGSDEQAWRIMKLYGLSRVSDYLIELFCPEREPPAEFGVTGGRAVIEGSITSRLELGGWRTSATPGWIGSRRLESDGLAAHAEFFACIGLTPFEHSEAFSPFHHEIFAVVQDSFASNVIVEEVLWWPGFLFGDLLFSRAGVRVRTPQHQIDATVATTSTLYFASRREPRPAHDLSHGWGSNSQWRTDFHRFYSDAEGLHFNWDGEVDIDDDPLVPEADRLDHDEDPLDQRRELLLHRCFVRGPLRRDEDDQYPYDDRLSLTIAEWPLRPESIVHVPWAQ